ncbi:MAG TPA: SdpI family protein [Terracidiphilus sp.]|nr:SdpI family protein [Terracidiphilus sp.]
MTRKLLIFELLMIAVAIVVTVFLLPQLPPRVATHWGMNGQPNGFSPKNALWIFGPGLLVFILLLGALMPWLSPHRFSIENFRSTYNFILLAVFLLMAYCYAIILWTATGLHIDVARFVIGAVCLLIAAIGNVLGKVRQNFYVGVRTPWTLSNERVWHATHRFAAKCFVVAGLLGLAMAMIGAQIVPIVVILVGAFAPVIYSLVFYKQLEHRGEL